MRAQIINQLVMEKIASIGDEIKLGNRMLKDVGLVGGYNRYANEEAHMLIPAKKDLVVKNNKLYEAAEREGEYYPYYGDTEYARVFRSRPGYPSSTDVVRISEKDKRKLNNKFISPEEQLKRRLDLQNKVNETKAFGSEKDYSQEPRVPSGWLKEQDIWEQRNRRGVPEGYENKIQMNIAPATNKPNYLNDIKPW